MPPPPHMRGCLGSAPTLGLTINVDGSWRLGSVSRNLPTPPEGLARGGSQGSVPPSPLAGSLGAHLGSLGSVPCPSLRLPPACPWVQGGGQWSLHPSAFKGKAAAGLRAPAALLPPAPGGGEGPAPSRPPPGRPASPARPPARVAAEPQCRAEAAGEKAPAGSGGRGPALRASEVRAGLGAGRGAAGRGRASYCPQPPPRVLRLRGERGSWRQKCGCLLAGSPPRPPPRYPGWW